VPTHSHAVPFRSSEITCGFGRIEGGVRELAMSLPFSAWRTIRWREGTRAALRIRPAHRDDDWSREPRAEEWLLIEWPSQEAQPTKY
jgi:hypothetical protein